MHRIAAIPGGWNPDNQGVIFVEQNKASIILLTAADTDIQTLAGAISHLPDQFPSLRIVNLLQLQQQLSIDTYADQVLVHAKVIILRLLGGRSYWPYGLEVVKEIATETGAYIFILPGDDRPCPDLISHSNVPLSVVNQLWRYFIEGGIENFVNALKYIANFCLDTEYEALPPQIVPRIGIYPTKANLSLPKVGIIFYRAHYLAGNTLPIEAICQGLRNKNLNPLPIFVSSLRDPEIQGELVSYLSQVAIILNSTSFAASQKLWEKLTIPVLQIIFSSSTEEQWDCSFSGLIPRDVAMNVALPEVDGRIITRAVSFKSVQNWHEQLETDVVIYKPHETNINFVVDLAGNWLKLGKTSPIKRKIAIILANYPNKDGRLANGVGLDTPASCLVILQALQQAGYSLEDMPITPLELMRRLTTFITNDPEGRELRQAQQYLEVSEYRKYYDTLPEKVQKEIKARWGEPINQSFPIPGIQLGNIFIGIQPSRGYDLDPSLNYHAPDLEPTHNYLAYYYWLKHKFGAHAIIHLGKHGNLEWLPGKSLALSENCYPEIALGTLPNFYPFIVNDPGEGSQAKRRSHAVIIDHLTPPLTRAELYGPLQQLEGLIDEYYEAQSLDPTRLKIIAEKITNLVQITQIHQDLGIGEIDTNSLSEFLTIADGYLCELKEAQIRDGLHIFGVAPTGVQLRDLIIAIARFSSFEGPGLMEAIATDLEIDATELLTEKAIELVDKLLKGQNTAYGPATKPQIQWIEQELLPNLQNTTNEITNLLKGLEGKYVPSGPSGAPTRGRADVLPTGRNFYSVDIRSIPTETAWDVGRKAAEMVIERYTQENGEYPQSLAISIWGTSTMRTGGDDVAQVLALLGVQPIWDGVSRRVVDLEILPLSVLGRPRVDVTIRVSGFFRDGFPNVLDLLYQAINLVSRLKEEKEMNPLAAQVERERELWREKGVTEREANLLSRDRIFGSKPGAYGAGLQGLIESQNWINESDLARAYVNWSSYAYRVKDGIKTAYVPEVFSQRLQQLQIVLHNQDNREHDLLDSDDYYQFQGGLTAAVRAATGKNPQIYFGDNSNPQNPKVRLLTEEIARVYRSRVINPKWIAGVMRHGYKGAFEMAATVDYLFAYDATTACVSDHMYQGVAEAYLLNEQVQEFIKENNPWALRDMAERLLEAKHRGLWKSISEETLEKIREIVIEAEGIIEGL